MQLEFPSHTARKKCAVDSHWIPGSIERNILILGNELVKCSYGKIESNFLRSGAYTESVTFTCLIRGEINIGTSNHCVTKGNIPEHSSAVLFVADITKHKNPYAITMTCQSIL